MQIIDLLVSTFGIDRKADSITNRLYHYSFIQETVAVLFPDYGITSIHPV